jgi:hypothetical protein
MDDVWVETVHETERRDGKKARSVAADKKKPTEDVRKRPTAKVTRKDNQGRKRAA